MRKLQQLWCIFPPVRPPHLVYALSIVCACVAGNGVRAAADGPPQNGEPAVITVAWPAKQPRAASGKVAIYKGEADAVGVALIIPAGTVFSRHALLVKAADATQPLTVRLKNDLSDKWDRTVTSDANGRAEIKYRTEGKAMVLIQSPQGRQRFDIVMFQSNEIPVHKAMRPPFVGKDAGAAASPAAAVAPVTSASPEPAAGTPVVMWVIAGLLAAILGVGVLMVLKKRAS